LFAFVKIVIYSEITSKFWSCEKMNIDSDTLDLITGGLAIAILVGGMIMMFTTVFTTKR
jgi:hypothetical protein